MIKYDGDLLSLTYLAGSGQWLTLHSSSITYAASYDPDAGYTLIVGSETLTFSLSGNGVRSLAHPLRRLRLTYSGKLVGAGYFTVDSYRRVYATDPSAESHGKDFRTEATCSAVSAYGAAMGIKVTYLTTRPAGETAYTFLSQWVAIHNWTNPT